MRFNDRRTFYPERARRGEPVSIGEVFAEIVEQCGLDVSGQPVDAAPEAPESPPPPSVVNGAGAETILGVESRLSVRQGADIIAAGYRYSPDPEASEEPNAPEAPKAPPPPMKPGQVGADLIAAGDWYWPDLEAVAESTSVEEDGAANRERWLQRMTAGPDGDSVRVQVGNRVGGKMVGAGGLPIREAADTAHYLSLNLPNCVGALVFDVGDCEAADSSLIRRVAPDPSYRLRGPGSLEVWFYLLADPVHRNAGSRPGPVAYWRARVEYLSDALGGVAFGPGDLVPNPWAPPPGWDVSPCSRVGDAFGRLFKLGELTRGRGAPRSRVYQRQAARRGGRASGVVRRAATVDRDSQIVGRLAAGESVSGVARGLGCSRRTVARVRECSRLSGGGREAC